MKEDIKVLLDETVCSVKQFSATVRKNENIATFIKEIEVELPQGEEVSYQPGDYLQFHVPPYETNTSDWKGTIDPIYQGDWELYDMFDREIRMREEDVIRTGKRGASPP